MDIRKPLPQMQAQNRKPVEASQRLVQKPEPFLLDVRQPEEFQANHIPGAQLLPLGELQSRLKELPKEHDIIVVCRSGNRSMTAATFLCSVGYQAVNLQGGMIAWAQSGLPVTRGQ
jgi:rhodanese-related sulfurtransferase